MNLFELEMYFKEKNQKQSCFFFLIGFNHIYIIKIKEFGSSGQRENRKKTEKKKRDGE